MKKAADLKLEARKALQGNYGNASGAVLVMYLLGFLLMIPFFIVMVISGLLAGSNNTGLAVMVYMTLVMMIVYMVLSLILMVGYVRLCYRIAVGEECEIGDLFFAVKNHFPRYLGLMSLLTLYSILSCLPGLLLWIFFSAGGNIGAGFLVGYILLLVVPVTVLSRYAMALFVLVEDPEMKVMEAMRFSKDLMQGNIWRMIRLEFSFLGIFMLGYLTFGIGYIWIMPYVVCANVRLYLTIKEEKYPPVYPSAEEEALEARFSQVIPEPPEFPI